MALLITPAVTISIVKGDVRAGRAQNNVIILVMHFLHERPPQVCKGELLGQNLRDNRDGLAIILYITRRDDRDIMVRISTHAVLSRLTPATLIPLYFALLPPIFRLI